MKVISEKKKKSKKRDVKPGHNCSLEVLVQLDRLPEVDEVKSEPMSTACVYPEDNAGCSHPIKVEPNPEHSLPMIKEEEVADGEPCAFDAVSPKLEQGGEEIDARTVRIKSEPEPEWEISQPGPEDATPCFKQEDEEGNEDVKQESLEEDETAASDHPGAFFSCPHCPMSFTGRSYLDKHLKWTHQTEYHALLEKQALDSGYPEGTRLMIKCPNCLRRFFTQQQLVAHERHAHPKPMAPPPRKRHPCPQCARSFHYLNCLQKHCSRWHRLQTVCKGGELHCARCRKSFAGIWGQGPHRCQPTAGASGSRSRRRTRTKTEMKVEPNPGTANAEPANTEPGTAEKATAETATAEIANATMTNAETANAASQTTAASNGVKEEAAAADESTPDAENLLISCPDCGKKYRTMQSMRIHARTHTGEMPCVCSECGRRFKDSSGLHKHLLVHTDERPFTCPHCGKRFARMTHLNSHLLTHTGVKPFTCGECGRGFSHRTELRNHERGHTGEKPFGCPDCGKHFAIKGNMRLHQKRMHSQEKDHQCGECGRLFSDARVLKTHLRTHTGERPYHCTTCDKSFGRIAHLKNHQRTHTGERPYKCEECGKSFVQSGDLTKHKRTHTGEKPFACPDCPSRFNSSGDLSKHRRSHLGIRPHVCQECNKSFTLQQHLKLHMRTHTGERPYLCPHCPSSFARTHHLTGHIRSFH